MNSLGIDPQRGGEIGSGVAATKSAGAVPVSDATAPEGKK